MCFSLFGSFLLVFSLCDGKRFNTPYYFVQPTVCEAGQNTQHLSKQNVILLATFNIQFFVCFSVLCVSQSYQWWTIYWVDIVPYTGKSFFDCNMKKMNRLRMPVWSVEFPDSVKTRYPWQYTEIVWSLNFIFFDAFLEISPLSAMSGVQYH